MCRRMYPVGVIQDRIVLMICATIHSYIHALSHSVVGGLLYSVVLWADYLLPTGAVQMPMKQNLV